MTALCVVAISATIIGPVAWTPANENAVTILASVSADGDPSNADGVSGEIPVARLAHCDNNIAGRSMTVSAAGQDPVDHSEVVVETRVRAWLLIPVVIRNTSD